MTSLKLLVLAGTVALFHTLPAMADTTTSKEMIQHEPARALGGTVQPSIPLLPRSSDPILDKTTDLDLQGPEQPRPATTPNLDVWESELLNEQRRIAPGFFTITAD